MSKELEAFYDLIKNKTITDEMIIIEKELKALEIIKRIIENDDEKEIPEYVENNVYSKEEYELLKEVLL